MSAFDKTGRKRMVRRVLQAAAAIAGLLAITSASATDSIDASWAASANTFVPHDFVAGSVYKTELATMTGYLAVFPAGADDPKTPGSAFDWGHVLVVKLQGSAGSLKAISGELRKREAESEAELRARPREISAAATEAEYIEIHRALAKSAESLPPGTVPCDLGAWSEDKDPRGLNVRAEPNAQAKVLGRLPPPFKFRARNRSENTPPEGWLTEFRIIGFKDGWFLIEGAQPPGKEYENADVYPRRPPTPYSGRGWVAGNKIGAAYANGDTRMGGLFQAPHVDAKWTPAKTKLGGELGPDGGPNRILACSGTWALVESSGVRGWWRRLCSNQVTNCS
jgi:hypothetical protein